MIDPTLTGLDPDTSIDGTELIELLDKQGRRAASLRDVLAAIGGVGNTVAIMRTADGSVGQSYFSSGSGPYQWLRKAADGSVAAIAGATTFNYAAQAGDINCTLGCLSASGTAWAPGPVLSAPFLLDDFDLVTPASGTRTIQNSASGVTAAAISSPKVQGAAALQVTGPASNVSPIGSDRTLTTSRDPATLKTVAWYYNRQSAASMGGRQAYVFSGSTNGSFTVSNESSKLPGGSWDAAHIEEFTNNIATAGPGIERYRLFATQASPYGAQVAFDAMVGNAGGITTLIFSVDDWYVNQYNYLIPLLNSYGIPVTICPALDRFGQGSGFDQFGTLEQLLEIANNGRGNVVACDGTRLDGYISTDPAGAAAEIAGIRADTIRLFGRNAAPDFVALPYGGNQADNSMITDAVATAMLGTGAKILRGIWQGDLFTRFGFAAADRKKMPSWGIGQATDLATLKTTYDRTAKRGGTLGNHLHLAMPSQSDGRVVDPATVLIPYLNYIKPDLDAGRAVALNINQLIARDYYSALPL